MSDQKCLLRPIAGLLEFMCNSNKSGAIYHDVSCRLFDNRLNMPVEDYLCRLCRYSECSKEVLSYMFLLLGNATMNKLTITHRNVHRLVLTSFVVACKLRDDIHHDNVFYARVGGVPLETLNEMEILFLNTLLKWELSVPTEDVDLLVARVEATYTKIAFSQLRRDSLTRRSVSLLKQNEIPPQPSVAAST
eukprot:TRINITY_DN1935_c4_g1_i1.p1 TRINITY_DN1935_c4_g1~~TRINITY_DN1935_c4_g1_i1.p1  ORF type:complete len:202 (+),score=12.80 TRINITY_DN1935_c4_g1_i1:36-608(+)